MNGHVHIGEILERHGINSYSIHREPASPITEIELAPYSVRLDSVHHTIMISGRFVPAFDAVLFEEWLKYDITDFQRLKVDHGWWYRFEKPILEIIGQMMEPEPEIAEEQTTIPEA